MSRIQMKELLEAGVHFGHQTRRWNPKMKPYIFSTRKNIHILDLQKTVALANKAAEFITTSVTEGKTVLFVGTKKQAKKAIAEQAARCGMPYVNNRWLGGMLTNYATVRRSLNLMLEIEGLETSGGLAQRPVKERMSLTRRKEKLQANLGGIRDMQGLPDILFVVDTRKDTLAVAEARRLNIPVVALVDTNCDPEEITYPIPANDDAIRAIALFCAIIADAVLEGQEYRARQQEELEAQAERAAVEGAQADALAEKVAETGDGATAQ